MKFKEPEKHPDTDASREFCSRILKQLTLIEGVNRFALGGAVCKDIHVPTLRWLLHLQHPEYKTIKIIKVRQCLAWGEASFGRGTGILLIKINTKELTPEEAEWAAAKESCDGCSIQSVPYYF